jgi:DNA modification methylase
MGWTSFNKGGVKIFKHLWNGLSRKGNRKDELKSRVHPTQKPVGLFCEIFRKFTDFKTIYDGFLGSGSTLIACEKMDRVCYGMELDPKYCDVIVKRWEQFTGKKAELENGQN